MLSVGGLRAIDAIEFMLKMLRMGGITGPVGVSEACENADRVDMDLQKYQQYMFSK